MTRAALAAIALLCLGATCHGPLPGTWVNVGDSFAWGRAHSLEVHAGCPTVTHAEGGTFAAQWLAGARWDAVEASILAADGPVTVALSAGSNDETALPPYGAEPAVVADRVTELVERILALRDDVAVVQTRYAGTCRVEFFDYLPHSLLSEPRYAIYEMSDALAESLPMADACHPAESGYAQRMQEMVATVPLAAEGRCWE